MIYIRLIFINNKMSGQNYAYIPTNNLNVIYNHNKEKTIVNSSNIVYKIEERKYNTDIFNWITIPLNIDNEILSINLIPKKNNVYEIFALSVLNPVNNFIYEINELTEQNSYDKLQNINLNCSFIINSILYKIKIEFMVNRKVKIRWLN